MLTDLILEKKSREYEKENKNIWGRYDHIYSWSWNKESRKTTINPIKFEDIEKVGSVFMRDQMIAMKLNKLGIKKVLDVGSDTGHLIATLASYSIDALGVDSSSDACNYIEKKGVNHCYKLSIQDLITIESLGNEYDCLVCLNITHAKWEDEKLKSDFIAWIRKNFEYAILSDITHQDKKWGAFELLHRFNIGRFYYNKLVQFIYKILGIDTIIHYSGIQKLYKIRK